MKTSFNSLGRNNRGAVLAEFAFAFMPVCTMFLFVVQFSRFEMCRLATYHAANVGARACSVINAGGEDINPGGEKINGPDTDANKAAKLVLAPFLGKELTLNQDVTCNHAGGPSGTDTVDVNATYTCDIPVAKKLMCPNGTHTWTFTAMMPHSGAEYKIE